MSIIPGSELNKKVEVWEDFDICDDIDERDNSGQRQAMTQEMQDEVIDDLKEKYKLRKCVIRQLRKADKIDMQSFKGANTQACNNFFERHVPDQGNYLIPPVYELPNQIENY